MVGSRIIDEMVLKTYGSMLIFCRLSKTYEGPETFPDKYRLWLVVSPALHGYDARYLAALAIPQKIKSYIGKGVMAEVRVISADNLVNYI